MLLSITANLLHVVMLKRPLNLLMAENNSESVDVDPHSNTDTTTVTCLPVGVVAAVRAGALLLDSDFVVFEIETQARLFFGVRIWLRT